MPESKPKAILVANTDWYLYNFRLHLARFLQRSGYEVVLVSPPGRFYPLLQAEGFRWLAWEAGRQTLAPWKEAWAIWQLAQIYRQEQPAVVHHFTVKPVVYGSLAARWLAGPGGRAIGLVNSITGLGYVFVSQNPKARLIRQAVKSLYRLALSPENCAAIFENQTDRSYFIDQGLVPARRTWLIEGVGVDPERFQPLPEPEGKPVVVLAARMLWDKGVGVLVEAARRLHPQVQARFALVGEPDPGNPANIDRQVLEAWDREGVIEYWGWQEDMRTVYERSHIVTLPSMGEGVPTVLLEAGACGRPVVATDVPGCRDVVRHGDNGLLVPPNDPQALAEALLQLIGDAQLRGRMGAAGREFILSKHTHTQVDEANLLVYQSVLGGGSPFSKRTESA